MTSSSTPEILKCCLCGRELAAERRLQHEGSNYCLECAGAAVKEEEIRRQGFRRSPGLALVLSFIPGLGQMYNGQVKKGALVLGAFLAIPLIFGHSNGWEWMIAILTPSLWFWNLFDAYWTAKRINEGGPIGDTMLPDVEVRWESATTPAWGVLLIVLGLLFLLNNFEVTWLTYDRLWPAALLLLGLWLLYSFAVSRMRVKINPQEPNHGENQENLPL